MKGSYLHMREINHAFDGESGKLQVLRDVNLIAEEGQFVCLIGPSGCGKSTLLDILAGLISPSSGEVLLEGEEITGQRGNIAYMPQRDLLFPWRTTLQNVVLGAEIDERSKEEVEARAKRLLPLFGLEGFEEADPRELSGGMRQRAALLRTVLLDKNLMALDEPFGSLDALTRGEMQDWLVEVWQELEHTIIFVTHDIEEALLLGDRVFVMSARPGRILEDVSIDSGRPRKRSDDELRGLKGDLLETLKSNGGKRS